MIVFMFVIAVVLFVAAAGYLFFREISKIFTKIGRRVGEFDE
jgi:Flp pilus assembly pilin Flp